MFRRYTVLVALVALCSTLLPSTARAGLSAEDALLGFGSGYTAPDGSTRTHRGVDIGMRAGAEVRSPVGGIVRFAGRVPGPHGGTVLAVSIVAAQGTVSLLPLQQISIRAGETVGVDDVIGEVASSGDPSSDASHIHVGLRADDLYLDPSPLLATAVPAAEPEREPQPQESGTTEPSGQVAETPAPPVANAEALSEAPVVTASAVPDALQSGQPYQATGVESRFQSTPHGVDVPQLSSARLPGSPVNSGVDSAAYLGEPSSPEAPAVTPLGVGVSVVGRGSTGEVEWGASQLVAPRMTVSAARAVVDAGSAVARTASAVAKRAAAPLALGLCAIAAAYVLLMRRRAFERRIQGESPVSDRLGRLLQQLRAGDTLCGLTSCSGHAAFTVPEPSSPGEVTK